MNRDYDHIKELFDSDDIKAPESLSEENIFAMLPDQAETDDTKSQEKAFKPVTAAKRPEKKAVRKYIALAACALAVLIGIRPAYNALMGAPDTSLVDGDLRTFESYGEIERLVNSLGREERRVYSVGKGAGDMVLEESADSDALVSNDTGVAATGAAPAGATEDHSSTYLQVEDVDEADIVKTDGKYIYYVNNREEVVILSADNGKTEKLSTISNNGVENYVHDIFLKGDTLVTVGVTYDEDDGSTAIVTYDISDRSKPQMIREFKQSGNIVSSRMVGSYVYLVTTEYVYKGGRVVPMCTVGDKYSKIPVSDICCIPEPKEPSYVILSAVDISKGKTDRSKSKAVFGGSDTIYCNDHNLYTAVTNWNYDNESGGIRTTLLRASLDGLDIRFSASGSVRGYVNDQFSMNEKDGHFFIATTSQRDGMDVNNLFVLDQDMKEVGNVSGFARNESIKSVRFVGSKAYVITYEAIDPLFVIDVSDPTKPVIEGEVKIDGFSSLLIPVSEERLLGIGYATGDNGYGGEYASGLKLALFDVSDPSKPEVVASKEFKDMDSPAQNTHLALTVNKNAGWFAIPYSVYNEVIEDDLIIDGEEITADEDVPIESLDTGYETGVLVFSAGDDIKVIDQHRLSDQYLYRSVYIGDYIYALDGYGEAYSFKIN